MMIETGFHQEEGVAGEVVAGQGPGPEMTGEFHLCHNGQKA